MLTEKEKEELKNTMHLWGSYKYILSVERSELANIQDICKAMKDIKAMTYDGMPRSVRISKPVEQGIVNSISLCEGRIEKLNSLIKENMTLKQKIDEIVDTLPHVEQYILKARYVENMSWEMMPLHMPFEMSKRHCQRFHNNALEAVFNKLHKSSENDS